MTSAIRDLIAKAKMNMLVKEETQIFALQSNPLKWHVKLEKPFELLMQQVC